MYGSSCREVLSLMNSQCVLLLQGCISKLSEYFREHVFILGLVTILLSAVQVRNAQIKLKFSL